MNEVIKPWRSKWSQIITEKVNKQINVKGLKLYRKTVPKTFTGFHTGKVCGLKGKFHNEGSRNSVY